MNQHFVPKCYLKEFATSKEEVYVANLKNLNLGRRVKPRNVHISTVCYRKNFYNVPQIPNDQAFQMNGYDELFIKSKALQPIEQEFQNIRDRLITGNFLTFDDILFMSDFIIYMKLRNPYWRENIIEKNKGEWLVTAVDNITAEENGMKQFENIPSEIKQLLITNLKLLHKNDPEWSAKMQKQSMINRSDPNSPHSIKLRSHLLNADWSVLEVPLNYHTYFITSDNPGFAVNNTGAIHSTRFIEDFGYFFH